MKSVGMLWKLINTMHIAAEGCRTCLFLSLVIQPLVIFGIVWLLFWFCFLNSIGLGFLLYFVF
jgi:hypothetical protein